LFLFRCPTAGKSIEGSFLDEHLAGDSTGAEVTYGIQGRVVVITGGGNGIGQGTALLFGREGAKVAVVDVDEAGGHETERLIANEGGQAFFVSADVSRDDEVKAMVNKVVQTYSRIDILFANAAIQLSRSVAETEEREWDRLHAVNLKGVFLCCKYALAVMQKQKKGAIVITSSGHANVTYPNCSAYAATKGALVAFMRGVALDYAADGIRANCVLPGTTDTRLVRNYIRDSSNPDATRRHLLDRIPLGHFATPEDIGRAVVFLASDHAAFITGTSLIVDGGQLAQG
jgi:NAD(P)-dependent dehydrogenase (short-subunit alcohol dehydrogenase family)